MADEKDRLGEKLHDVEAAREDQWARQRDAELLEKMRKKLTSTHLCPKCGKHLVAKAQRGISFMACPDNDGAWIEISVLNRLLKSNQ